MSEYSDFGSLDLINLLTPPNMPDLYNIKVTELESEALLSFDEPLPFSDASVQSSKILSKKTEIASVKSGELSSSTGPVAPESVKASNSSSPREVSYTRRPMANLPSLSVRERERLEKIEEILAAPPIENDSLEKLVADIAACTNCPLSVTRKNTVPGHGNPKARLMLIGEAPGAGEDEAGLPFVGKAGQHLDKIIAAAGFDKSELYICNILKCRPPMNRDPSMEEMRLCTPFLDRQINIIKPDLLVCLGNVAIRYIISPAAPGVSKIHGQWFDSIFKIPAMPMYHPSALIRSESRAKGSPNWVTWQDVKALKKKYDSLTKN
ncbi:MAG: uracil-DNA glycosylase [Candidatus Riflebacteria bacterium]|nr:uracil-DNA glycosylase [Candidatus Riflebacteria bacterium]